MVYIFFLSLQLEIALNDILKKELHVNLRNFVNFMNVIVIEKYFDLKR